MVVCDWFQVFQPMLIEYFTYDELKELKVKVIQQHEQRVQKTGLDVDHMEKCYPEFQGPYQKEIDSN